MLTVAISVDQSRDLDARQDYAPIVVALGGNAILRPGQRGTVDEQLSNLGTMAAQIAMLAAEGLRLVVTHGNGPQVGNIYLQQDAGSKEVPAMPLDVCGAMSQGLIGYLIEQALSEALAARHCQRPVVAMITRTLVDPLDPAFQHPTKPIGPFYDTPTAERLRNERGWVLVSDSGRGYRRVVPSPVPLSILGSDVVNPLLDIGAIVVTGGGGGIPVVVDPTGACHGLEAVVDKDLAACLLARQLGARTLVLLTDVPEVCINYGTPQQQCLGDVSIEDMERLDAEGQFPPGSMGPKIHGALGFLRSGGELAVITSPEHLGASLIGGAGTRIHARR